MKNAIRWIRAHKIGLALAGIFVGGFILRIWGMSAVYQRIDDTPVARQIYAVYQGYWSPDPILFYPIFFNYIVGILLKIASAFLGLIGVHSGPGLFDFSLEQALLAARLVSATMGALTILLVFKIGKILVSEKTGLAASFFLSASFVHILYSHQIVLDVPMTFFYAISLYFCARVLKEGRWLHYLAAAFFAGIAVATKYNAVFVVFSIFLAHLWKSRETGKKWLAILFDKKLLAAAGVSVIGFFAGHPYALLWFRSFLGATRELAKLVHETEWYLVLIKPQTFFERLAENKWVLGLQNILSTEGILVSVLILAGLFWVLARRRKGSVFFVLSGLVYFLGTLGFLGFSRLRDLSTFSLYYAVFAAFGLAALSGWMGTRRWGRRLFAGLTAIVVVVLGARSIGRVSYLAEDDTTQIAERWIRRNIPPGRVFGRELFTPEISDPAYPSAFFTRPFLIYDDFPPFERFDIIETSSVQGGFFHKYAKYYPAQVEVYSRLNRERELLKTFFFKEIEYKNPEVKLYSGKTGRRPKQRLALPAMAATPSPGREFEMVDGSVYGKDVNSFWLTGGGSVERIFVGRMKPSRVAVFVRVPENGGRIIVRSGFRRWVIPLEKGRDASAFIAPASAFPFDEDFAKIRIEASDSVGSCFVKLSCDAFDIGLELIKSGDYAQASDYFRLASENASPGILMSEIALYQALCAKHMGKPELEDANRRAFAVDPLAPRLRSLVGALDAGDAWQRAFEKYSGVDTALFEETLSLRLEEDQFTAVNGAVLESGVFPNKKALIPSLDPQDGLFSAESTDIRVIPQDYRLELALYYPSGIKGNIGDLEVMIGRGEKSSVLAFPIDIDGPGPNSFVKAVFAFKTESYADRVKFRLRLKRGTGAALDFVTLVPDLKSFLRRQYSLFGDELTTVADGLR